MHYVCGNSTSCYSNKVQPEDYKKVAITVGHFFPFKSTLPKDRQRPLPRSYRGKIEIVDTKVEV